MLTPWHAPEEQRLRKKMLYGAVLHFNSHTRLCLRARFVKRISNTYKVPQSDQDKVATEDE